MDVLLCNMTKTLTKNNLMVIKKCINVGGLLLAYCIYFFILMDLTSDYITNQVPWNDIDKDAVIPMAAQACTIGNGDKI